MNAEGRRSREAVRNSIRSYGVKVMDPASLPLKKTKQRESHESISRFSEKSLHSHYEIQQVCWNDILNRVPYATLLATVITLSGILVMAAAGHRSTVLTKDMASDVLRREYMLLGIADVAFLTLVIITVTVGVLILIIGVLATGDTRTHVYKAWRARIGGRFCCILLLIVTFGLFLVWLMTLWGLAVLYYFVIVSQIECDLYASDEYKTCIYVVTLNVLRPSKGDHVDICDSHDIKRFCRDFVEKAQYVFLLDNIGVILVLLGLVLYLICLASNYARIQAQSKFQDFSNLHHIEIELGTSKDRF